MAGKTKRGAQTGTPRQYTVVEGDDVRRTYKGFNRNFNNKPGTVGVLLMGGDPDVFALDDTPEAVEEFRRYVVAETEANTQLIGIYRNWFKPKQK